LAKQQANTMNNSLIGKYKLLGCFSTKIIFLIEFPDGYFIGKYSVVSFLKTVMNQWNVNISGDLTLEVHNNATKDPKKCRQYKCFM